MKQDIDVSGFPSSSPAWHQSQRKFEEQIGPHIPAVRATARRILGDGDDAADAVQEALIALWEIGPVPDHLRPWLIRTVVHRSLHSRRSKFRRTKWEDRGGEMVMPCALCTVMHDAGFTGSTWESSVLSSSVAVCALIASSQPVAGFRSTAHNA